MRTIKEHKQFKRDLKRIKSGGPDISAELVQVLTLLRADKPLPDRSHDHALKGTWVPARECHIRPDVLLVYLKEPGELKLLRLASHSELFE